jgi:hypothetical protein
VARNREPTDAEVAVMLERFDLTTPALQRRIIARLVTDRVELLELLKDAERFIETGIETGYVVMPGHGDPAAHATRARIRGALARMEAR